MLRARHPPLRCSSNPQYVTPITPSTIYRRRRLHSSSHLENEERQSNSATPNTQAQPDSTPNPSSTSSPTRAQRLSHHQGSPSPSSSATTSNPNQNRPPLSPQFPSPTSLDRPSLHLPPNFGQNQLGQQVTDEMRVVLEGVVRSFRGVRWAVGYGSGVFAQTGYTPSSSSSSPTTFSSTETKTTENPKETKAPMIDLLLATSHPSHFHSINLQSNPSHYPLIFRWLGAGVIARVQEWGGGVWFVTDVDLPTGPAVFTTNANPGTDSGEGKGKGTALAETGAELKGHWQKQKLKYGVISIDRLCADLMDWNDVYLAGRMHKPVRIVRNDPRVLLAAQVNLASALRTSLLLLPPTFPTSHLYTTLTSLSYSGDPRMSIPGGENPNKVKNIVGGSWDRFGDLYRRLFGEICGVGGGGVVDGGRRGEDGEVWLQQADTTTHRSTLLRKLPRKLRRGLEIHYNAKYGITLTPEGKLMERRPAAEGGGEIEVSQDEFWRRLAEDGEMRGVLQEELKKIMRTPALKQSFKGLLTAGFRKSVVYAGRKIGKWWGASGGSAKKGYMTSARQIKRLPIASNIRHMQRRHATNKPDGFPTDRDIPYRTVQLVSNEDNSLGPPQSLSSLFATYSDKTHTLRLVSHSPPIVKLLEKKVVLEKIRDAEKKEKTRRKFAIGQSELQVTWESAQGDLHHKISHAKQILEKGDRVDIAFVHRSGGNHLSGAALEKVQETYPATFRSELASVGQIWRDDRVEEKMMVLHFEPSKEARDGARARVLDQTDAKKREKEERAEKRRAKEEERMKKARARQP